MRYLIIIAFCLVSFISIGQREMDSLWGVWNDKSQPTLNRLKAMDDIAWVGYLFTLPDSAFYYAQQEYDLAETLIPPKGNDEANGLKYMSKALNTQGVSFAIRGNNPQAIKYYKIGLDITERIGDQSGVAAALNNIGNTYKDQGDFANAIDFYTRSLILQEKLGNKKGAAATHGNIGLVHYKQGNYPKAIEHHKSSLDIEVEIGNKKGVSNCYGNMGMVYSQLKEFDKARAYHERSLALDIELNDNSGMGNSLINIGNVFEFEAEELENIGANPDSILAKYNLAIDYYEKSIEVFKEIENQNGVATNLVNIGKVLLIRKELVKANEFAENALAIARITNSRELIRDASIILFNVNKQLNNTSKALEMYELFIAVRDSIDSEENQKEVLRQEYKYVYDKQVTADSIKQVEAKKVTDAELAAKEAQLSIEENQRYSLYGGLCILFVFAIFMYRRFRVTRKQKIIIEFQKTEVEKQKEFADKQRLSAEIQKALVEEKNTEILDSMNYAKRIQKALLPPDSLMQEALKKSFVLYKPKDIVAGDFYWLEQVGGKILFAAADCTGHGVPGAMVSVICNNALNRSVREFGLVNPGEILSKTREIVIEEFAKSDDEVKDGMDIALCSLDGSKLMYSGAHNPLWLIRDGEVIETKANKQPIGKFDNLLPYTTHTIELEKRDSIYIFSDGYVDQFGGPKGKKFKAKAFRSLLVSIQGEPIAAQKKCLDEAFENWRGTTEQIDDVCVIGVRI